MNIFFTADMHMGHGNVTAYCKRPFIREGDLSEPYVSGRPKWSSMDNAIAVAKRMNEHLINEWNMRVKDGDIVYHLGDFCTKGRVSDVPSVKSKSAQYEAMLNGKVIHITGNHDKNNGVKGSIDSATVSFGNYTAMLIHIPPCHEAGIPDFVDFVLCGHVHEKWDYQMLGDVPLINVGVDVRKYRPMSMQDVLSEYARIRRKHGIS